VVASAVELDALLLDAKLTIPPTRPDSVSRDDLIQRARTSGCRIVGVTAPAGYGKSTLLAHWARVEDRPVGWVSLDRFDDDPSVLLTLLASAYARVYPDSAYVVVDMPAVGSSVLGRAAPRLASVLRQSSSPFVLMLDDLHELQSSACHDVLGVVMSGVPESSQVVVASRAEQPHLPRLRASGDAVEFRASDLAFDPAGAEHIFALQHITLTPEAAIAVTLRTEGWPVGLHLAALIAHDGNTEPLAVTGDDRYVADYLYRESMVRLPKRTRRFLRRTAVLDHLSASLCDALIGEPGSQEQLRTLEAANAFIVPLDRHREWYRYHDLFREFLMGELHRVEPDLVAKLHLRAADWYESHGSLALALEHLLNTTERDRSVQLTTQLILPTYQAGQMSTVQRWLATLGDTAVERYPPLAVLATWIAAATGATAEAQRLAGVLDEASFDLVPLDGSASFESARAMIRSLMCAGGPAQAMADAAIAVAEEPAWSLWRDAALVLSAVASMLAGDADTARTLFTEAASVAAAAANTDSLVISESELAVLAMDDGHWVQAAGRLDTPLAAIDEHGVHDYAFSLLAFAAAARLAVQHGDLALAQRRLAQAMRARPSCTFLMPYFAVRLRLQLARVYAAVADEKTARHLLGEIDEILLHRPGLGALVEQVSEFRRALTANPHARAVGVSRSPLSPAELRLLPYLQTHLTIREIGERLFVSRNTVSTELGSIYRKLGVSSRNEAVQQATAIGLLGG